MRDLDIEESCSSVRTECPVIGLLPVSILALQCSAISILRLKRTYLLVYGSCATQRSSHIIADLADTKRREPHKIYRSDKQPNIFRAHSIHGLFSGISVTKYDQNLSAAHARREVFSIILPLYVNCQLVAIRIIFPRQSHASV